MRADKVYEHHVDLVGWEEGLWREGGVGLDHVGDWVAFYWNVDCVVAGYAGVV